MCVDIYCQTEEKKNNETKQWKKLLLKSKQV
jgi:hypothetical protein